jgi:hypothetical protein
MAEITLEIGATAHWDDGPAGEVLCLVVDPTARRVTYLVVEPKHRQGIARLVPPDHVGQAGDHTDELRLRYTEAEFEKLNPAEEGPATDIEPVVLLASQSPWTDPAGFPGAYGALPGEAVEPVDLVPSLYPGEEEEWRGDPVHATDGHIGYLHALRIDRDTGKVTSVLLKKHLWGHKDVTIPIDKVSGFSGGIHLSMTKHEVQHLAS